MEESSEAHMDTDVSSTTEDIVEVQGSSVNGPHRNVETVVVVEVIKEEDMRKERNELLMEAEEKTKNNADYANNAKTIEKSPQKDSNPIIPIKKIFIKSPLKEFQPKTLQKSPTKLEDDQKSLNKDIQVKPIQSSNSQQAEDTVDSSSKIELTENPKKDENPQKSPIKDSDVQKNAQKIPTVTVNDKISVTVPSKITTANMGQSIKNSPAKSILKEVSKVTPTKEPIQKVTPIKILPIKEPVSKSTSSKEMLLKITPVKETLSKISLLKESVAKTTPVKESVAKTTPVKESVAKTTPVKESVAKTTPVKESVAKTTPIKEMGKPTTKPLPENGPVDTSDNKEELISKSNNVVSVMDVDKEASNDSQTNSDISEKEHNKSISRELRSLINSAKESKIISECTQLTSKTRKSRTPLDNSITNSNTVDADKIQVRRGSDNSQKSGCSEKSDKTSLKRSMRSQNPEFVSKVKHFLSTVTGKGQKEEGDTSDEEIVDEKSKENNVELTTSTPKKKKPIEKTDALPEKSNKLRSDAYCWRCHWAVEPAANEKAHPQMHCTVCPRSFHFKCLTGSERNKINFEKNWVCPECLLVLHAESSETRSPAMKKISLGMLCELLKHALERMMDLNGVEPFMQTVDRNVFPDYDKYIVHPMDLSLMKEHIAESLYGSTEAFLADAQWILHNSIIFNTLQSKLTAGARALVRSCRAEMGEIEACPECYAAAHARRPTWFTDVCSTPHVLLWAKLKGFPYWPAKGMSVSGAGLVDVRFFGAHDRAWVPARDCFLFSEKDPNNFRTKRQDILDSMQEAQQHIRNITRKYGKFVYPPFKTQFDPAKLYEQLKMMIPSFEGEVRTHVKNKPAISSPGMVKEKSRSNSKSSKSSFHDCDTSEGEDGAAAPTRKMADGAEIAREEDDSTADKDKDKTMEVDVPQNKEPEVSRKRRRSNLEEANNITILMGSQEKKRKMEGDDKPEENTAKESKEPVSAKEVPEKPVEAETSGKVAESPPKSKDESLNTVEKKTSAKTTPVRVISIAKVMQTNKQDVSKGKEITVKLPQKPKQKIEKSNSTEKDKGTPDEKKSEKRRNSKGNKSLNSSTTAKTDKSVDKNEKLAENSANKEKHKEKTANKNDSDKVVADKNVPEKSTTDSPKSKSRVQDRSIDDDTSLAVIARQTAKNTTTTNVTVTNVYPTISSVRSLSTANAVNATKTNPKTIEVTVEATSDSSIFTPTSTDNVRNMKEAVNKLQKLRETEPPVGRVGVRAFARMTSPEAEKRPNDVQVEIKAEPMDLDDADRQMEKLDLMNAFRLRPVNPPPSNLRDVRINKVVVTPVAAKKPVQKPEVRPRAKKTFPQPKKADEGRSELNSKNSMVYIPIQPPMTQAPVRAQRPVATNGPSCTTPGPRAITPVTTCTISNNNVVNTVTTPLVPVTISSISSPTPTSTTSTSTTKNACTPSVSTAGHGPTGGPVPTVGQVPTTVHTVPLITTVNGQWTFSLQPVMSVGGVDGAPSPPITNGLPDCNSVPALLPLPPSSQAPSSDTPTLVGVQAYRPIVPVGTVPVTVRTSNDSNLPGELPRLQQRPSLMNPLDANTPMGNVPPPSTAGPLTAKLNQNAVKMTDFFRTLLEDSLEKLDEPLTQLTALKLQLEQVNWRHQQQLDEIKHNYELSMAEIRSSFEKEKVRLVSETRRAAQCELENAVKLAKSKQWCANCNQEAQFYCCWNTSYCDYPCQRAHWAQHYAVCTQQRSQDNNDGSSTPPESRLQPQPENLPKTTAAPSLVVGNKLAPSRVYAQDVNNIQKSSIIVSMVEDVTGNQTMKCVGTYKPQTPTQMSPLILNKQLLNSEEAKKVVTSGGYLIVGAAPSGSSAPNTQSTVVTPARRTHTIQYYT